ncbi:MAG: ubiquinone/menaquinone biosynthesis C-methylase UbiE [Candidatus Omnitrophota bacterium]|jgi:ubiquinone/menaquinone biosynthesis C-methylase UbiE
MDQEHKVNDLNNPIQKPLSDSQSKAWQKGNAKWWESNPMRYDWNEKLSYAKGSKEYFEEIDNRFFYSSNEFLPFKNTPFEKLINFESLKDKDVLEIGVGHGSHAQLIAPRCRSFTGIDLTNGAITMTRKRFEVFDISGNILQMDAENMSIPDASIDWIWSWGVIHHSSNTNQILKEIHRILRPGGQATIMVYHRSFWKYYIECGIFRGIFKGDWWKYKSLNKILQNSADGALARFYTAKEFEQECAGLFSTSTSIAGQKNDLIPIPAGKIKYLINKILPNAIARLFTNSLQFGTFLIADLKKL